MILTTGSLFSGICSEHWALSSLVKTKHVFAADNDKFACQFIRQNVRPDILVEEDLAQFNVQELPYVDVKPKYFIFENVPPFQTSEFFPRLVRALKRIYTFVEHTVLNAAEYGSIQRRKRLFVRSERGRVAPTTVLCHSTMVNANVMASVCVFKKQVGGLGDQKRNLDAWPGHSCI